MIMYIFSAKIYFFMIMQKSVMQKSIILYLSLQRKKYICSPKAKNEQIRRNPLNETIQPI